VKDDERPVRDFFLWVLAYLPAWGFVLVALVFVGIGWLLVDAGSARDGIGRAMVPVGVVAWIMALACLFIIVPVRHDQAGPHGG
jgi:hypothetical protein